MYCLLFFIGLLHARLIKWAGMSCQHVSPPFASDPHAVLERELLDQIPLIAGFTAECTSHTHTKIPSIATGYSCLCWRTSYKLLQFWKRSGYSCSYGQLIGSIKARIEIKSNNRTVDNFVDKLI